MVEDRRNTSFAKKMFAMYIISFIIGDENGCKTNSVFYIKYTFNYTSGLFVLQKTSRQVPLHGHSAM